MGEGKRRDDVEAAAAARYAGELVAEARALYMACLPQNAPASAGTTLYPGPNELASLVGLLAIRDAVLDLPDMHVEAQREALAKMVADQLRQ